MIYPRATLAMLDMTYYDMARYDISLRQKNKRLTNGDAYY